MKGYFLGASLQFKGAIKFWARLIDSGVATDLDSELVRPIRMTNRMSAYGMILSALFSIIFTQLDEFAVAAIVICCFAALGTAIALNKRGHHSVAPFVGVTSSCLAILVICTISLEPIAGQYLLTSVIGMPLLMFQRGRTGLILACSAIPVACLLALLHLPHGHFLIVDAVALKFLNDTLLYAGTCMTLLLIGHYYGDMVRDTAVIKKQQELLVQSARMSEFGLMAAGVAHEINNPLTVIRGRAEMLRHKLLKGQQLEPEALVATCEAIEKASERVARIVKGLKHVSRDGSSDPFEIVPLAIIIEDVMLLCKDRIQQSGISMQVGKCSPEVMISCRSVQIAQVLINLLSNSLDAVDALPERWVVIEFLAMRESIEIYFSDSGKGIDEKTASKMMLAFFTTKTVGKGTGLGLSISRAIVEEHKGELRYLADASNTTFCITLPRHMSTSKNSTSNGEQAA